MFKALTERFENHRLIIDTHLAAIINYRKIHIESHKELRSFIDCINKNLRSLKVLKYEQNNLSDAILINIILQKLDAKTTRLFQYSIKKNEYPQFQQLMSFLENRAYTLESESTYSGIKPTNKNIPSAIKTKNFVLKSNDYKMKKTCVLCKNISHSINKCPNFLKMNVSERFDFVKKNKLSKNCLNSSHLINSCTSKFNCFRVDYVIALYFTSIKVKKTRQKGKKCQTVWHQQMHFRRTKTIMLSVI